MTNQLPVPGTWTIDSVHSWVEFTVEHFTVAFARGIASGPTGSITVADDLPSSSVRASVDVSTLTTANCSLPGITRPVTLALTPHGVITDVWGKTRLGLTATTQIQRSDFDVLKWGHVALSAGGFMVPDAVRVTLEIEAVRDEEP